MTKRLFDILALAAGIVFLAGCQKEEIQNRLQEISIDASIDNYTKASALDFDNGDSFGLYILAWDGEVPPSFYGSSSLFGDNLICTKTDNEWKMPRKYWPETGKLDFYAYYPWNYYGVEYGGSGRVSHTISADQTDVGNYNNCDFMTATAIGTQLSKDPVKLTFSHRMSKVSIKLIPGEGLTPDNLNYARIVAMNQPTECYVNLKNGEITGISRYKSITPLGSGSKVEEGTTPVRTFITVPHTIKSGSSLFTITTGNMITGTTEYIYTTESDIELQSGYSYIFEITLVPAGVSKVAMHKSPMI